MVTKYFAELDATKNQDEIADVMINNGFNIIYPSKLAAEKSKSDK